MSLKMSRGVLPSTVRFQKLRIVSVVSLLAPAPASLAIVIGV
jgi:hypothetical protein